MKSISKWAAYNTVVIGINAVRYLESFHIFLKRDLLFSNFKHLSLIKLTEKKNCRLDQLISILLGAGEVFEQTQLTIKQKFKKMSFIHKNHSQAFTNKLASRELVNENNIKNCCNVCRYCGIYFHAFSCSCYTHLVRNQTCEQIHLHRHNN